MIDDKKIEEAAIEAADLYEQDLPMMSYNEDTEVDGQHHFCQEFGAELFKDGAKWAINEFLKDLWHPVSEKPERNTPYLAQLSVSPLETLRSFETFSDSWHWEQFSENSIIRWCYIDDLLPKQKGDNHD